jgi:excisionase family DNA binding protein
MSDLGRALVDSLGSDNLAELAERLMPFMGSPEEDGEALPVEVMLTCSQAAQRAGTDVETIRRAIRSGALCAGRAGRSPRIAPADLDAWLAGSERGARPVPSRPRRAQRSRSVAADAFASLGRSDRAEVRSEQRQQVAGRRRNVPGHGPREITP